jgi:hypothetical protein
VVIGKEESNSETTTTATTKNMNVSSALSTTLEHPNEEDLKSPTAPLIQITPSSENISIPLVATKMRVISPKSSPFQSKQLQSECILRHASKSI